MNRLILNKAEQIARYVIQGAKLTKIAQLMGMSYEGIQRITKLPEYLDIEADIRARQLGGMDEVLARKVDFREKLADDMEDAVPEAMSVLFEQLRKKRDLKAALEVLDRDPQRQFAKGASAVKRAEQAAPAGVIDSTALSQAVNEADITHSMLEAKKQRAAEA